MFAFSPENTLANSCYSGGNASVSDLSSAALRCIGLIEYPEYGVLSGFDTIYVVAPTSCESLQNSLALTLQMLITVGGVLTVVGNLTFGVSDGVLNITLVSTQLIAGLCCSNQS